MEKFYNEKKTELIKQLFDNTTFDIDIQSDFDQVAVWCETFGKPWSICFQNGDMNGRYKGTAIWTNDGANEGLDDLFNIIKIRNGFKELIDPSTYHKNIYLEELINDFICEYDEKENFDQHFSTEEN